MGATPRRSRDGQPSAHPAETTRKAPKSMIGFLAGLAAVIAVLATWPLRARHLILLAILLGASAVTRDVISFGTPPIGAHLINIAPEVPTLTTIDVVILAGLVVSTVFGGSVRPLAWIIPGLLGLLFGKFLLWTDDSYVSAGALHFALTLAAWPLGRQIAERDSPLDRPRFTARIILCFLVVQLAFCLVQISQGLSEDRTMGTFDHPAHLGKVVLILLIVLLPLSQSQDPIASRTAMLAIGLGVLATASTLSRANIISVVGAIALWATMSIFSRGARSRAGLVGGALLAILASLPFVSAIMQRFSDDAEGGLRPELFEGGVHIVLQHVWFGTGPNNFAEAAAAIEPIFAQTGAPIHNTILLLIGELGVPIFLLVALPLIRTTIWAIRALGAGDEIAQATARSVVVVVLMAAFAGWTGWGFLVTPVAQLLYFFLGFADGVLANRHKLHHLHHDIPEFAERATTQGPRRMIVPTL